MRGAERRMQTQVEGEWSGGAGWACLPGAKTLESAILFSPLSWRRPGEEEEEEEGWRWRWVGEGRVAEKRMWWHQQQQQQQQVKHRAAATEGLDAHWFLLSAVNTNRLVQDDVWQLTEWNGGNSVICCLNIVAPLCFHNDITCSQCTTWRLAEWQERLTCNMTVRAVFFFILSLWMSLFNSFHVFLLPE